jgi:hypothetical protein
LHLGRLGPVGVSLNRTLQRFDPDWDGSPMLSMLVERESLGISFIAVSVLILLSILSVAGRIYGRHLSKREAQDRDMARETTEVRTGVTIGEIS